ncbi:mycofactocin-coupled SDR family oxidoreductase [Nocardia vaccinii]|uniref:mycofactocin-coupled SDR family oxidoreductase n=1 Tax=Nocardia vaccinii TaxID=1822 RepID=UPI00082CBAEF|nr:mycofactocin-coupled SDR family oxidoreductase [Nocardia vaccinii]
MTKRLDGKVAFITGAARGQGRSHALRLAEEGANIIALDLCANVDTLPYGLARPEELADVVEQVEKLGQSIVAAAADVRDYDAVADVVKRGVDEFGHLDIVSANAGVCNFSPAEKITEQSWQDVIDINLTGVWHTAKAAIPAMIDGGRGGSIVLTSSTMGLKGARNVAHYTASKHGVVGIMRSLALELAEHHIRVNSVHPTNVDTDMILNDGMYKLFRPDLEHPTIDDVRGVFASLNTLPVPWVESIDVSNALVFLASDEARYITGVSLPIDAGALL